jgi:hypothetical protein
MADRKYTIILKNSTNGGQVSPISSSKQSVSKATEDSDQIMSMGAIDKIKNVGSKFGAKFGVATAFYGAIKTVVGEVDHNISLVSLRTGSNELQAKANYIRHLPSNLAKQLDFIGKYRAQEVLDTQKAVENVSLQINLTRAGANGSRGNK